MDHLADQTNKTPVPRLPPQPLQRTIILSDHLGAVEGRVEDNVHDFSVVITHDGIQVTSITGGAHRVPWTSCPFAVQPLQALVGAPLVGGGPRIDPSLQCTHLFDLARLAMAQAARGGARRYDVDIVAEAKADAAHARLWRDGVVVLDWRVQADLVIAGDPFIGHKTSGRAAWPAAVEGRPDLIEAALVLRRCLLVFRGRRRANVDVARASELPEMVGACFSFQPERSRKALRPLDFTDYEAAPIQGRLVGDDTPSRSEAAKPGAPSV